MGGANGFLHEDPAIRTWWRTHRAEELLADTKTAPCLITGKIGPVAATHSGIKGFPGGHASGVMLVSFNQASATSWGLDRCINAPVAPRAVDGYMAGLRWLLEREIIIKALKETKGNVTRAAQILQISRKSLQNKMKEFDPRINNLRD